MSLKILSLQRCVKSPIIFSSRYCSSVATKKTVEEIADLSTAEHEPRYDENRYDPEMIEKIRNISRLNPSHRNILNGKLPFSESMDWFHDRINYKRRMMARYGLEAVGAHPGICWPLKEEIEDMVEYERVKYPQTLHEAWQMIEEKNENEKATMLARDREIEENMKQVNKWQKDLAMKVEKKEAALRAAKERKDRLIEEVRQHFGFKIDMKDERFKLMMEQKEKEDKKRKKAAKKQEKTAKLVARLQEMQQSHIAQKIAEQADDDEDVKKAPKKP